MLATPVTNEGRPSPEINNYDPTLVHDFGEYKYAFNFEAFHLNNGERLELWKNGTYIGQIKMMSPVGMGLEDLLEDRDCVALNVALRNKQWLMEIDRAYIEIDEGTEADQVALYEAGFQVAHRLGAQGIVSEWDEPKSKELWETVAPTFNATIKTQMITVGQMTDNPRSVPVYIALFDAKETVTT